MFTVFEKLSKVVTKHNKKIITIWALFFVFCLYFAPKAFDVISPEFGASEDLESQRGNVVLKENFPEFSDEELIMVVDCEEGSKITDPDIASFINSTSFRLISMAPDVKEVKSIFLFDPVLQQALWYDFVNLDNSTTIIVIGTDLEWEDAQDLIGEIRNTCCENTPSNVEVHVTGLLAVNKDLSDQMPHDLSKSEYIGLPLIALLLFLLFRRVRAIVAPFITIGVALIASMALLYAIGQLTKIYVTAINTMIALGLGIGFDYSVFMISRFKEERGNGMPYEDSVQIMVQEAGHTITMSGFTVMAAFAALLIPNLAVTRSMGYSTIGVVIFLIIANLTLLPALLMSLSGFLKDLGISKEK
ncbi:MAG: MMPL family transporter, partial [Candidatus Hodarchaeota archaeon]